MENENRTPSQLRKEYLAEYENACDYLYYGYGYESWKQQNQSERMSDTDAKKLWGLAKRRLEEGHRY